MNLPIRHLHKRHKLLNPAVKELFERLAGLTQKNCPHRNWQEIGLVLADDPLITDINFQHLGRNTPTDVISFTYDPIPGEPEGLFSGEVFVNVERAWHEGARRGNPDRELALYIAHGCLHLTGADDATPAQRAAMSRTQNQWLKQAWPGKTPLFALEKHRP